MNRLHSMLEGTPAWLRILVVLGTVAGGAATFGADWLGLPERVHAVEAAVATNTDAVAGLGRMQRDQTRKLDRVICLLTLPDTVTPIEAQRRCP